MEKSIIVKPKDVYGIRRIYPVCEKAMIFAKLTGKQTLTIDAITYIKQLGYTIKVQQEEI